MERPLHRQQTVPNTTEEAPLDLRQLPLRGLPLALDSEPPTFAMNTLLLSRRSRQGASSGFSLAELMVVIVIIGILATLVVPNVVERLGFAQSKAAAAQIVNLDSSLKEYVIRNGGNYPDSLEALVQPDENGVTFLGLKKLPLDPWKQEYYYEPPGGGEPRARIYSLGKDGEPGGSGDNKDIDNWPDNDDEE